MFGIVGLVLAFMALMGLVALSAGLGWVGCDALVNGHRAGLAVLLLAIWALAMWFVATTSRGAQPVGVLYYLAGFVSAGASAGVAHHVLVRVK